MSRLRAWLVAGMMIAAVPALPAAANMMAEDAVPRVADPLCPGVMGIQTDVALQILERIRSNAQRLDIRLDDPEKCKPNLLVAFVDDGRDSVAQLMRSQPQLFETLSMPERRALAAGNGPARAWNYVATRTLDGMRVPLQQNLQEIPQFTTWSAHSKIYGAARQDIISTVVLFDNKGIGGLTTTQLADYATMRSFATDYSAHPKGAPTILSLFDSGDDRPSELTGTDLAFLKSLYSGIANLPAAVKNRSIAQELQAQGGK